MDEFALEEPEPSKTTWIYALCEPGTDPATPPDQLTGVRYVGKSNGPRHRFWQHKNNSKNSRWKEAWIAKLKRDGLKPVLVLLEECSVDQWKEREPFWEDFFRARGERLTNLSRCGVGPTYFDLTEEGKQKKREILAAIRATPQWKQKNTEHIRACWANPEYRRKMIEARLGKKQSDETCQHHREAWQREAERFLDSGEPGRVHFYEGFVRPDGTPVEPFIGMRPFCEENGLDPGRMITVYKGRRRSHRGWTCVRPEALPAFEKRCLESRRNSIEALLKAVAARRKTWSFISPEGEEVTCLGLDAFCIEHGLSTRHMRAVAKGSRPHHRGWTCPAAWNSKKTE